MFEHPPSDPSQRTWERSLRFYMDSDRSRLLMEEFTPTMDAILEGKIHKFDDGEDHNVYLYESKLDGTFVVKRLKPLSREILILGKGIAPDKVRAMQKDTTYTSMFGLDTQTMVHDMQLAHEMLANSITQYKFLPTAITTHKGELFRFQRYVPRPDPHNDPLLLPLTMQFYDTLKTTWPKVVDSKPFKALPPRVQAYYEYFGIDDGIFTNAIFRGFIGIKPDFVIIDY